MSIYVCDSVTNSTATPAEISEEVEVTQVEEEVSATPPSDDPGDEEEESGKEVGKEVEGVRKLRPRESIKAPERFQNYVAK